MKKSKENFRNLINPKTILPLSISLLFSSSVALSANNNPKIPAYVGHNIIGQVEDVREEVKDLIGSLKDAGVNFAYADWKKQQANLSDLEARINKVETRLEHKKELVDDDTWSGYINSPNYKTSIHDSVNDLGQILTSLAEGMKEGGKTTKNMPIAVANNIVDDVENVRESVEDFVETINDSGERFYFYNWAQDRNKLADYEKRLEGLEEKLDRKQEKSDSAWTAWFGADVYKVTVHDSLAELGSIMKGLASSLSGQDGKTAFLGQ